LDADNRSPDNAITALVDDGGDPLEVVFRYDGIPYTVRDRGALALNFSAPHALVVGLAAQYTGPTLIQTFTSTSVGEELFATESFWVVNLNASKTFKNNVSFYLGVDNVFDYVQSTLGIPLFDYNWGPLRGTYFYAGVGYRYGKTRS
jgi:outer membrane receptor protein involved in Fe transport